MISAAQAEQTITMLNDMMQQPGRVAIYGPGSVDAPAVETYWEGWRDALRGSAKLSLLPEKYWDLKRTIEQRRGWENPNITVAKQMTIDGSDEATIIDEVFTIEIETWRALLEYVRHQEGGTTDEA